ncbi:lysine--tRNA ligase [Segnochrobactrum spirostomi]|uniref:Lysine--tRNA ligase n=1 Tax=Segnochrobactrum spirostomi TaxID=2608987 RepID=A0A6A7Y1M3_9HYPH|nr:lysine--tRNA ligase [Segnochrobactrum spirostomi]MQT12904.1 lysine--tRNA ligase [Segnochrobactrum spirostomi]
MTERFSPPAFDEALAALSADARAWPFEEARKLVARVEKRGGEGTVLFETGYGPSGLPHIGTFGEVARTTMVRQAFRALTKDAIPTRLLCFSDDMDGLRKVPDNVPNKEMLRENLGKPLTVVPDPFGQYPSFGQHNNARLRHFLDTFGFEYEFASATDYYKSGRFDRALLRMLEVYDEVMAIMLPTLGEERQQSYSPFMPISPRTGEVLQVPIVERKLDAGSVVYRDPETGDFVEVPVTGGHCKLQWKPDWGMRWYALGVDYEMAGKDLIPSVKLSAEIARVLGGNPPDGFNYELFLDENGQKISKSKGNGLTIEDWLNYASPESLSLFMFNKPRAAKKLYFEVIPRTVDDYYTFLGKYPAESEAQRLENPVWHIHSGAPPKDGLPISFSMLLNLVSASNAEDRAVLWGFISRYAKGATPATEPELDRLVGYAIRYFADFVKPNKKFRAPDEAERNALAALDAALAALAPEATADAIQDEVYEVGRTFFPDASKTSPDGRPGVALTWFSTLYQLLLGQERGPRFGSFVAIYGIPETRALIAAALARTASPEAVG